MINYIEYQPCLALKSFIKTYYLFETETGSNFEDFAYATGNIEIMFNIGDGKWKIDNGVVYETPKIELWGQIINPLQFKSVGKNSMLGVRFHTHTAALLLKDNISLFNNKINNLSDVVGNSVNDLYETILESRGIHQKIVLLDNYFLKILGTTENDKIKLLSIATKAIENKEGFLEIEKLSKDLNISARYLHRLFVQHTGVSPKLFHKIVRFQQSLLLLNSGKHSLTSIGYECGYFDQSHFIKNFKQFTGKIPSDFSIINNTAVLASSHK